MDPTACLKRILDAMAEGDREESMSALQDLTRWIGQNGHLPLVIHRSNWDMGPESLDSLYRIPSHHNYKDYIQHKEKE